MLGNIFIKSWRHLNYKDFIQQFAIHTKTNQNSSQNQSIKLSLSAIPNYFLMYAAIKKPLFIVYVFL